MVLLEVANGCNFGGIKRLCHPAKSLIIFNLMSFLKIYCRPYIHTGRKRKWVRIRKRNKDGEIDNKRCSAMVGRRPKRLGKPQYMHLGVKFLEYYRFYKTKYLVDSFYIFLCPLAELITLSSSMSLPYTCREILSTTSVGHSC